MNAAVESQISVKEERERNDGGIKAAVANYEYVIVSDGSGHAKDGSGGCASIVIDQDRNLHPVIIANSRTTVTRMEFTGLLEGLALIKQLPDYYPGVRVMWFCDHQSMVEMVNDRMCASANADLWVLFDYYTMTMAVEATHIPRNNTSLLHNLADLHASTAREVLLDYVSDHTNFPKKYEE